MTINELLTKFRFPDRSTPFPFDFSSDHTAMELLRWFERERKDMCEAFQKYFPLTAYDFSIFLERKGKSYMRWVVLLYEWLGLEETREKWGWEECPCPPEFKGDVEINKACPYCNGSGKIRAEWAREEG